MAHCRALMTPGAAVMVVSLGAWQRPHVPAPTVADRGHWANFGHACSAGSPAVSLAADKVTPGFLSPTEKHWVEIARSVPGGFAGYGMTSRPGAFFQYWLVDTTQRRSVEPLLRGQGIPVDSTSTLHKARWSYAQLSDWKAYLMPRVEWTTAGIDISNNRIEFGAFDVKRRHAMEQALARLAIPCNLVYVRVSHVVVNAAPAGRKPNH